MSIRIVFMGSPDFALPSLSALVKKYQVVGVVTQPDRASGRGRELKSPEVKSMALELKIPILQPEKLRAAEAMTQLKGWAPDLIVVAAFGQILRRDVLELPRYGCINVHASLLPRWRGAGPVHAAILAGDEETGVTIMKMDAGLDTGPMLSKISIQLTLADTAGTISQTLSQAGADLLIETLPDYLSGKLTPRPQPKEGSTYAPMLKKEDGRLEFSHPAVELGRRVRAMNPWPGAWFTVDGKLLKVARASVSDFPGTRIGSRLIIEGRPAVTCAHGALVLEDVQLAGRKWMSGQSFLAGSPGWASTE